MVNRHRLIWLSTGLLLAGLLTSGCDNRVKQCNQLVRAIHTEQEPIKSAGKEQSAEWYRKMSGLLDNVGAGVEKVQLENPELQAMQAEYVTLAKELAVKMRETAEALEAEDHKTAHERATEASAFQARETTLVNKINNYCSNRE